MSVYTVQKSTGNAQAHPLFEQYGLKGYTSSPLNTITLTGQVSSKQIAYAGYAANIDAFISATMIKRKVNTSSDGFPISDDEIIAPLPLPPVAFTFKKPLNQEQRRKFLESEKYAAFKIAVEVIGKVEVYVAYKSTLAFCAGIRRACDPKCSKRQDTMCIEAAKWVEFLWRCIYGFLASNSYPAYRQLDSDDADFTYETPAFMGYLQKRPAEAQANTSINKRTRFECGAAVPISGGDIEMEDENIALSDVAIDDDLHEARLSGLENAVLVAKPSEQPFGFNIGGTADVPNLPGLLLPYFSGMIVSDKVSLRRLSSSLFLRLFGTTGAEVRENYKNFRAEIESLTSTELGVTLSHILTAAELALSCQAQLYVIIEGGRYYGSCLLGGRFAIHHLGIWYKAKEASVLKDEIAKLASHDSCLVALCSLLSGLALKEGDAAPTVVLPETIGGNAALADEISMRVWTDSLKKEAEPYLRNLNWPGKEYRKIDLENIIWALDQLSLHKDTDFPHDQHFYIGPRDLHLVGQKTYRVFASFGPHSFSLLNKTSGTEFKIVDPDMTDPADVVDPKSKKRAMNHILIAYKPSATCCEDWDNVVKNRRIKFDLRERAGAHRSFQVADKGRDRLWAHLKASFKHLAVVTEGKKDKGKGKKKEKVDDEEIIDDMADFLGL